MRMAHYERGSSELISLSQVVVDEHLDKVLRASGSSLHNYSMASTLAAMRKAMSDAMLAARQES